MEISRYGACLTETGDLAETAGVVNEFKELVKQCHRRGMEVILDVVFNHTAEGNDRGPCLSFRGLGNRAYYMLAPQGEYYNYSGCGNTVNCNHPVTREFILDCLRYWVVEMHVDGFRFDLAPAVAFETMLASMILLVATPSTTTCPPSLLRRLLSPVALRNSFKHDPNMTGMLHCVWKRTKGRCKGCGCRSESLRVGNKKTTGATK